MLSIKSLYFLAAAFVFAYLIIRAVTVPPVHDEAATFMHYIQRNEWMPFKAHWDANNHILNSFLSSIVFKIFGHGLLQLRLASLLFFPLFVVYVFRISGFIQSIWVKIGFLCGMLGVHNLIEYFGYSRGYAMSMALLMAAIYYVLIYLKGADLKKLWLFYFFSALALVANLTLFNTIVLLNGFLFLSFLFKKGQWLLKIIYIFLGLVPLLLIAFLAFEMKKRGLLYYGNSTGFYDVTLLSLSELLYGRPQQIVAVSMIVFGTLASFMLLLGKFREGSIRFLFTYRWFFALLFLGNIAAVILLQVLVHVNYPEDRTAMYFYFFLVMFFCFSVDHIKSKMVQVISLVWLIVPVHFIFHMNRTHASYWWYEHIPNSLYAEVQKRVGNDPGSVSIGGYVLMDMIWAYYNHSGGGKLNDIQTSDYPSFYYDYLLLYNDNNNAFAQDKYTLLLESPVSHIRLLERNQKIELKLITTLKSPDIVNETKEFIGFFEAPSVSVKGDSGVFYPNLCFDFKTHFQNKDDFFFGMFTLGTDVDGQPVTRENQELHFFRTEWKEGYDFHHRIYVQNISPETDRITFYLWNPRKRKVNLTNNLLSIYQWDN